MSNIRLDLQVPLENGKTLTFKSPADCSKVTGLIVYYPEGNFTVSKTFQFADAHGNNVGSVSLFAENVLVKVILDTELSRAYVQNADTNAYLESMFAGDQKPVYTASSTLTALKSGEKLSVAFGKISKAVSDLITHLSNKQNPHGVTTEQLNLAKVATSGSYNDLSNQPDSLPANGGNADTIEGKKASDFAPSTHVNDKNNPHVVTAEQLGAVTIEDLPNLHIWKKYTNNPTLYTSKTKTNLILCIVASGDTTISKNQFYYSDKIKNEGGTLSLVDEITNSDDVDKSYAYNALGKYVRIYSPMNGNSFYYIPEDANITFPGSGNGGNVYVDSCEKLTARSSVGTFMQYHASKVNNAYPTSGKHSDGYWYVYHKQLGD